MGGVIGATMMIAFWSIVIPVAILVMRFLFSELFYIIGALLFEVIDILQSIFRKLAGLETIYYESKEVHGDILTSILSSDIVIDTMIAVAVFAIALVIIATIVQMVRTEYTTEGSKNSKEGIFAKGLKSLVMFILIPVVCFFGIRVSNYLLQAIDYATSSTGSRSLSGSVFSASVVNANRISCNLEGEFTITDINIANLLVAMFVGDKLSAHMDVKSGKAYVKQFENTIFVSDAGSEEKNRANLGKKVDELMSMHTDDAKKPNESGYGKNISVAGKLNYLHISAVSYFYDIKKINFLILYVGAFIVLQSLFNASMGMVVRMYKVTALFILAPAAIGLQPLDDGGAFKKWKSGFISNVLSAYGVIIALNLFFAIAGVVSNIYLWEPGNYLYYNINKFMQALFVVVGATQIKGLAKMIGDMIGGADAMAEGQSAVGEVGKLAASAGKFAGGVAKGGAYFSAKGKSMMGAISTAKTRHDLRALDKSGSVDETKRAELTTRLEQREAKRQIQAGRAKGIWDNSGAGKMVDSVIGGVRGVVDGSAFKGYDAATIDKLGDSSVGAAAKDYSKGLQTKGEARSNSVRNAIVTGGLSPVAQALSGVVGGVVGGIKGAVTQKGFFKGVGEGAKTGFTSINPAVSAVMDGDSSIRGESSLDVAKFNRKKVDAYKAAHESAGVARDGVNSQIASVANSMESAPTASYSSHRADLRTEFDDIKTHVTPGSTPLTAYDYTAAKNILTATGGKMIGSNDNSAIKEFAKELEKVLDGLSKNVEDEVLREKLDNMLSDGNKERFAHEYGAANADETKGTMDALYAQKMNIKTAENDAVTNIDKASDEKGIKIAQDDLSQALQQVRESGDRETQGNLRNLSSSGITIRGTDGEPLKVDSTQFVNAIKELKASVEAQNSAKTQKDIAKSLQDLLKETKKKK